MHASRSKRFIKPVHGSVYFKMLDDAAFFFNRNEARGYAA